MNYELIIRVGILLLALFFGIAMSWVGIGFMGLSLPSVAIHSPLVLVPVAAIGLTLWKRHEVRGMISGSVRK